MLWMELFFKSWTILTKQVEYIFENTNSNLTINYQLDK
jgi:hypothetical protein